MFALGGREEGRGRVMQTMLEWILIDLILIYSI